MHVIEITVVGNAFGQRAVVQLLGRIPANVRQFLPFGIQFTHNAWQKTQPWRLAKFQPFFKEQLMPQANPEKWFAFRFFFEQVHQASRRQFFHSIGKGADTRQNNAISSCDFSCIAADYMRQF